MLISAEQQSDSVTHMYILFYILFHYGLTQDVEYSSCASWWDLVVYPFYIYSLFLFLLSHTQLFAIPWMAACQTPLSSTVSQSLLKFMCKFASADPKFPLCPSPASPCQPQVCSLCLCVIFCFVDKFICVFF